MANEWCGVNCPIDCDDILTPIPDFGCEAPNDDDISEVFFSRSGFDDIGDLTEWNTRLSNSATDTGDKVRSVKEINGSLPGVDPTFKTTPRGSSLPQETDKVITFSIYDDKDTAFTYWSQFQCGAKVYAWFRSGKHIYGGDSGIESTILSRYEINPESDGMAHAWLVQIRFRSKCFPSRDLAVI